MSPPAPTTSPTPSPSLPPASAQNPPPPKRIMTNLHASSLSKASSLSLTHSDMKLAARHYKFPTFAFQLLEILDFLRVPCWSSSEVAPQSLRIHKVSRSLTNSVFFVSSSTHRTPTVLLRIYGQSSESLIPRLRELHTLHVLSTQYHIGPKVYGTFANGRIEEYFDAVTLTPSDLRDAKISRWIGARMADLHSVDIDLIEQYFSRGKGWTMGVEKNVNSWLTLAREVLALPCVSESTRKSFDLDSFERDWVRYMRWVSKTEDVDGPSKRVLSHNDMQYGNLLLLKHLVEGTPEHRQITIVDFEYASPNPAGFDIANHFHEWTADYHSSTPHILNPSRYPTCEERRSFYRAYLEHSLGPVPLNGRILESKIQQLDKQVRVWSPASHAMWALWGIVQSREDLEGGVAEPDFDYLGYAQSRREGFCRQIKELGIQ